MRKNSKYLPAQLLLIMCTAICFLLPFAACSSDSSEAAFQVVSLGVVPAEAEPGEKITIQAQIQNTGNSMGVYKAQLMLNGEPVYEKTLMIDADSIKSITYTFTKENQGTYTVALGKSTTKFSVRKFTRQEVELKYDNGNIKDALYAGVNGGFLVDFMPPHTPFTIDVVRICLGVYGTNWEGRHYEVSILNKNKIAVATETYPIGNLPVKGSFPFQPPVWVDIDIADVVVTDKFYVHFYTGTGEHRGIQVGVDDSVLNEHSQLTQGMAPNPAPVLMSNIYPVNYWYRDSSKVNWMIRVLGNMRVTAE